VTLKRHAAALVCIFSLIGIATAGPAAATGKVGVGTLKCHISGKILFNPPLKTGGTAAETITVKTTLKSCTGTKDGATVTGGTAKGTTTRPNNDCGGLAGTNTTPLLATTHYTVGTGDPALANSKVKYTSTTGNPTDPPTFVATGTVTGGSFKGDAAKANATIKQSLATIGAECNGTGVSVLTFNVTKSIATLS
jgi:hypothetical protein